LYCIRSVDPHLQALQEAAKHLAKSRATDREEQMAALDARMQRIQRICAARDMLPSDPAGAVTICQQLLQELPDQQVRISTIAHGIYF
jgi:hypothetical protein